MKNRWSEQEASLFKGALAQRVYTSRLLGSESSLVLHGGGNTSVKIRETDFFGREEDILYVKGSGHDLAGISETGFAPVRMEVLLKLAELPSVSDTDMVRVQRTAMTNPSAPDPSIEAVVHAILPFRYVDHTHADAVVTISNSVNGESILRELFGKEFLFVPYVKPGFILSQKIREVIRGKNLSDYHGLILLQHGVFTFDDSAKSAYSRMISMVNTAEEYLLKHAPLTASVPLPGTDLLQLASVRKKVSELSGGPVFALAGKEMESLVLSSVKNLQEIAAKGPLTPDHIIRTKKIPAILGEDSISDLEKYVADYREYFNRNKSEGLQCLDPAPRWAIWKHRGTLAFGRRYHDAAVVADIVKQTVPAILKAEILGGYKALPERELFEIEYWELEQAKLKKRAALPPLSGKIILVTGAASGIGAAVVEQCLRQGAAIAALDINPAVNGKFNRPDVKEICCDVTKADQLQQAVEAAVSAFGGLDVLVSNAGIFTSGMELDAMQENLWQQSMEVNLNAQMRLLRICIPYLRKGIDPAVILTGSKNVPAPGPGAGAYSVAKAALTQLGRVAALELGSSGIRVNMVHPNAVFDTGVWNEQVLKERAEKYGMTAEEYRKNNILKTVITASDVASMVVAMAGTLFSKTTGAQIPVDGGNERVI
ncbi:MAG: bifunctional aldolase/short-chain dehydrogenase [Bacteroidia bacterium]|nr:bifunctional aldolase/short-chain dehydrogenase [Bacteroidia bacterium]